MKSVKLFIVSAILIFTCIMASGQGGADHASGLYINAVDFGHQTLTYSCDCKTGGKIHLHNFFESSKGYVILNGQKHPFAKLSVYGYRDCKNRDYRFYKNATYRVIDTTGFYMYKHYQPEHPVKGKDFLQPDEYYFSAGADGPLQPLTIANLEKAFPYNTKFHYEIDETCKSDKDLVAYDRFLHSYKIKYLFTQAVK